MCCENAGRLGSSLADHHLPEDRRLPLLPLIILPLLPMLASLDVFKVPVSVRSMAISLRLRAAWILDWKGQRAGSVLGSHLLVSVVGPSLYPEFSAGTEAAGGSSLSPFFCRLCCQLLKPRAPLCPEFSGVWLGAPLDGTQLEVQESPRWQQLAHTGTSQGLGTMPGFCVGTYMPVPAPQLLAPCDS